MPFYNQHSTVIAGVSSLPTGYTLDNSLRFRESASAYLTRTPSSAGDRKTFTISYWHKKAKNAGFLFEARNSSGGAFFALKTTGDTFNINDSQNSDHLNLTTTQVFRDVSSWYHIVVAIDTTQATSSDRAKLYVNGEQVTSFSVETYPAQNADMMVNSTIGHYIGCGVNASGTPTAFIDAYLTEINFIDGQALDPTSFGETDAITGVWKPKEYTGTYGTNGFYLPTTATTQADGFNTVLYTGNGASQSIGDVGFSPDFVWIKKRSGAENHGLFDTVRGPNYFFVSNASTGEYARGNSITTIDSDGFSLGDYSNTNVSGGTNVAWCWDAGANQATTGISSVAYTGTGAARPVAGFGFSPDLIIAKARSAGSPLLYDSVRGAGYYLQPNSNGAEGNDITRLASYDSDGFSYGSFATGTNASGTEYIAWGWDAGSGDPVSNTDGTITSTVKASDDTGFSIVTYTGTGTSDTVGHGLTTTPNIIIVKNRDTASNWSVNGNVGGLIYGTNKLILQTDGALSADTNEVVSANTTTFGLSNSGATNGSGNDLVAYCFSEVSGISEFGSYSGTGSAGNSVTGLGFKPGFLMIKRTDTTAEWIIVDSSRSPFNPANDILGIDALGESDYGTTNRNIDFDNDGFTIQSTAAGGTTALNASGGTYFYMAFKGSYSDYVSPLNTDGDIDSRVKANTTQGFSVVSYDGDGSASSTVGHGLSSSAEMIILKDREVTNNWRVWHKDLSANNWMYLNLTNAQASAATDGGLRNVDATTFGFINGTTAGVEAVNTSGRGYLAYCWHSVSGYSDFGTYTGTGSSGNTVTDLGFQPAFLMIKNRDSSANWMMYDNTRDPTNEAGKRIYGDLTNAEQQVSPYDVEFTATGFTLNNTGVSINASGDTYIYMAFADTRDAQFNFDASGNKNNWTANNINSNASSETSYDIMTDVPTLTDENTANYCTLVPYTFRTSHGGPMTLSEGNLKAVPIASTAASVVASMSPSSGKFYWEITFPVVASASTGYGLCTTENVQSASTGASGIYYVRSSGGTINSGGSTVASSVGVPAAGDIMSIAYDADANEATFRLKNVVLGTGAYSVPTTSNLLPFIYLSATTNAAYANFGQRPFKYTPPDGFLPLNTYNLPDATIEDGSKHFDTVLYTGDGTAIGSGGNEISDLEFQPDFTWIKARNQTYSHELYDAVRGATNYWSSDQTDAEHTNSEGLASFDADGFTLGSFIGVNQSSQPYVAWNWKGANGTVSNTDGSITTTVSANPTAGISIFTYTGSGGASDTLGHGLGVAPEWVFVHDLSTATFTSCYHIGTHPTVPAAYLMRLNTTDARLSGSAYWNNTKPTSSLVTIGTSSAINDTNNYVMYCFAPVEGFSAFGSYTGNGSSDGPFIYTGFRPAFIILKAVDRTGHWTMFDSARDTYNLVDHQLEPNYNSAEYTPTVKGGDFLSNGWKCISTQTEVNQSGYTYLYAAFAENPFKNALAR